MRLHPWFIAAIVIIVASACTPATDPVGDASASTPSARASDRHGPDGAAARWFTETGCSRCHAVSSLGVRSASQMGPDLSIAVEDVPRRFGVPVEQFLERPSGTMALVLGSQIVLSGEQRAEAARHLRIAFDANRQRSERSSTK